MLLAERLRAAFLDTGVLYRALTLQAIERGISPADEAALTQLARNLAVQTELKHGRELVDCVEKALRDHRAQFAKKNYDPFETALEDCRKAKSLITPDVAELLWGSIAFAIVAFVLMKFGWPAIRQAIQAREEKIRADLEAAESMRTEAEQE